MNQEKKKNRKRMIIGGFFAFVLLILFSLTLKAQWVVTKINVVGAGDQYELFKMFADPETEFTKLRLPQEESNRLDILVLGIRGIGEEFGGLLTDTILLLSLDQTTGEVAMTSIPRDLYITLPYNGKVKINELYSIGFDKGGENLAMNVVKTVVSQMTGVYVDGVVRVDFEAFKKLVNIVGGVDIYLAKPFVEVAQWEGIGGLKLPQGWNHLDGEVALLYARSRFSTSDFDRARRQQDILLALKQKITALKILSNPIKVYSILDTIGDHARTDLDLDIPEILTTVNTIDYSNIKRLVFTTENYLYQTKTSDGIYILLPNDGSFEEIQYVITNIFTLSELPPSAGPPSYAKPLDTHHSSPATSTSS